MMLLYTRAAVYKKINNSRDGRTTNRTKEQKERQRWGVKRDEAYAGTLICKGGSDALGPDFFACAEGNE